MQTDIDTRYQQQQQQQHFIKNRQLQGVYIPTRK